MLFIEGIITKLNYLKEVDPDTDSEVYSFVKTRDGKTLKFNSKTKIAGCKFKYLSKGDRVLVRSVTRLRFRKGHFIKVLELIDLEKKWESILKNDIKLNTKDIEYGNIIRPEIIKIDRKRVVLKQEVLNDSIRNHDFKKIKWKRVLELYSQGNSYQNICDTTSFKCRSTVRKIVMRHLELWGLI